MIINANGDARQEGDSKMKNGGKLHFGIQNPLILKRLRKEQDTGCALTKKAQAEPAEDSPVTC